MSMKYLFYAIIIIISLIIFWIISDTFTQPGVSDLEGEYIEMAKYRNENNTGPVIRLYAVYSKDTLWNEMKEYGDFMPHTKYGNTKVFFFMDKSATPDKLRSTEPYFDSSFQDNCVAQYEKTAMGEVRFKKYPFR
ncbi:hypothetical protein [Aquiflexum lacus]|uniref:hypothetical protein n=1 Tax=Aquiflexum lacus TaxID=2483805 RepID=UPI001893E682|nr:hypothetical protein [Aquiflexum lacus]